LKARIVRRDGWVVPMCCHEQQTLNNRWVLERINLFSIYREGVGEIVGGGHSMSTPHLSCFEVIQHGRCEYLPTNTALLADEIGMSLHYNGVRCTIVFEEISAKRVTVRYRAEGLLETGKAYIHVPLYVANSKSVSLGKRTVALNGEYRSGAIAAGTVVTNRGAQITLSRGAVFAYPENGFNSYLQVQKPGKAEQYAVLTCEIDYDKPEVILTVDV
jgi:hypothetical protein